MGAPLLGALAASLGGYPALLVLVVVLAVVVYGFHPIQRWRYRHIPGPPIRWLVGGLPEVVGGTIPAYPVWAAQHAPHGVFKVFMGAIPHVVVTDPVLVRRVLISTSNKNMQPFGKVAHLNADATSNSLLDIPMGPEWKEQRAVWAPFFTPDRMETYLQGILCSAERLDGVLDAAAAAGTSIDLWPVIKTFTLDAICTAVVGIPHEMMAADGGGGGLIPGTCLTEKLMWCARAMDSAMKASVAIALLYLFPGSDAAAMALSRAVPTTTELNRRLSQEFIVSTYGQLVTDCRAGKGGVRRDSFLAAVAAWRDKESGELKPLTWTAMMINIFLLSGVSTTAVAITHTIYFLSLNKDKEAAVLAEVDAFGRDRVPASVADLEEVPYLKAAMEEALRMMSPLPLSWRQAKGDMQLGPYSVPAGTWVHLLLWNSHRSGDHWEQPEEYRPERFVGEEKGGRDAFMPFGGGARRCPGYRLAMQEGVLALLRVYQRFTFELPPGQDSLAVHSVLTLEPAAGVWAREVRRT